MGSAAAIIIGAGHAGLAVSRCLSDRSIDHLILERGEVANSWKTERWDSLRLLTPNWQSRLPGFGYQGNDPDGFRTMAETISFIEDYANLISAPVQTHTTVQDVSFADPGYKVKTDQGTWLCQTLVIASGACNKASVPSFAKYLPPSVQSLSSMQYRNPEQLEQGGVLVVGASATGTQIAHEVHQSGRPVVMAVGEHVRVPRVYRDRDIKWWMDAAGVLDERYDEVDNIVRARSVPSLQLIGSRERMTLDLNALRKIGVRFAGRLAGINGGKVQFSGAFKNICALADLKMGRLLDLIDEWALASGTNDEVPPPYRFAPTEVEDSPTLIMDLSEKNIRTVIWATGYLPDYSWLNVPVFGRKGRIRHDGGVVEAKGMYLMGLPFLRKRKSSLIDGAHDDATDLCDHLSAYLDEPSGNSSSEGVLCK